MDTKKLRQKLLDLAIHGKLVPQDPNDEPASELLARIREEKLAMVERGELKPKDVKNDTAIYFGSDGLPYEKPSDGKGVARCIEKEVPFDLPGGWSWTRVASISDEPSYGTSKKSDREGTMPVLRMGNITRVGTIDYTDLVYTSDADDIAKYALRPGDLIFNRTNSREWVGKVAYYDGSIPAVYAGYLVRFRVILINPKYINYAMCTQYERNWCANVKTDGVNQSNINARKLKSFLVPVPPLAEQRRIVDALDKYLALVDGIERDRADLDGLLAQLKSKVLDLAVRGELVEHNPGDEPASELLARIHAEKLAMLERGELKPKDVKNDTVIFAGSDGLRYEKPADGKGEAKCIEKEIPFEVPEGWSWARLNDIVQLTSGIDLTKAEYNADHNGIPYITGASNFKNGHLIENRWTVIPKRISNKGELLFTCKGTVGEMAINRFEVAHIARQVMSIKPNRELFLPYLEMTLSWYVESIKSKAKGFIPGIERATLLSVFVPVPPLAEQRRIIETVAEAFDLFD